MERDDEAFEDVLDAVSGEIEAVSADGAYDKRKCYEAIESPGARANIPPRIDAQYWEEEGEAHSRNQNLARIDELGRTQWKQESGYHRRSLAETAMFRCFSHLWQYLFSSHLRQSSNGAFISLCRPQSDDSLRYAG